MMTYTFTMSAPGSLYSSVDTLAQDLRWTGATVTIVLSDDDNLGIGDDAYLQNDDTFIATETGAFPTVVSVDGSTSHAWVGFSFVLGGARNLSSDSSMDIAAVKLGGLWLGDVFVALPGADISLIPGQTYTVTDSQNVEFEVLPVGVQIDSGLANTADMIGTFGQMGLMARLAQASYWLDPVEIEGDDFNFPKAGADLSYGALKSAGLTYLTGRDLTTIAWKEVNNRWGGEGLTSNGLYLNKNAAALVARSDDALFLSFRGTNDNDGVAGPPFNTPDEDHWLKMNKHGHLFNKLFDALRTYISEHGFGIQKIYVTGHSLGAAMVEWFLLEEATRLGTIWTFEGTSIEVIPQTYASPGLYFLGMPAYERPINSNFWIDGDTIETATILGTNTGDENEVYHDLLEDSTALHSSHLYVAFAEALRREGIDTPELTAKALHGIDFDRVHVHVGDYSDLADVTADTIGTDNDKIFGSDYADIILGMAGNDMLYGGGGRDHLQGGVEQDVLYGGTQDDFLYGGDNADRLDGGMGKDLLEGGAGADTFYFYNAAANRKTHIGLSINDTITDFEKRVDKIDLSLIDTRLKAGDQAFAYLGLGNFSGERGEVRWEWSGGNTLIYGDMNGDKNADFGIVLLGEVSLLKGDFIL